MEPTNLSFLPPNRTSYFSFFEFPFCRLDPFRADAFRLLWAFVVSGSGFVLCGQHLRGGGRRAFRVQWLPASFHRPPLFWRFYKFLGESGGEIRRSIRPTALSTFFFFSLPLYSSLPLLDFLSLRLFVFFVSSSLSLLSLRLFVLLSLRLLVSLIFCYFIF